MHSPGLDFIWSEFRSGGSPRGVCLAGLSSGKSSPVTEASARKFRLALSPHVQRPPPGRGHLFGDLAKIRQKMAKSWPSWQKSFKNWPKLTKNLAKMPFFDIFGKFIEIAKNFKIAKNFGPIFENFEGGWVPSVHQLFFTPCPLTTPPPSQRTEFTGH